MGDVEWIKLTVDMFDNRKVKAIRHLPEGNNIILIWVMLLTLAGRCNAGGMIFLTPTIAYTPQGLADELGFEESTVKLALEVLAHFGMIQTDGFLSITNWEEYQNIEGLDRIRKQTNKRVTRYRERQKALTEDCNVTSNVSVTLRNATEEEKEKRIRIETKNNNTGGGVEKVLSEFCLTEPVKDALREFIKMRKQSKKPIFERGLKLLINRLRELGKDEQTQLAIINQSLLRGWQSVYPLKDEGRIGANGVKLSNEVDHTLDGIL